MTQRENLLRCLRRQGYEQVPYVFSLCAEQEEVYRQKTKSALGYDEYFDFSMRDLPWMMPQSTSQEPYLPYHPQKDDATRIDWWGVGHRTAPNAIHPQMIHPLTDADSEEQIQSYPLPLFRKEDNAALFEQAAALRECGLASVGQMQMTIWETAWYIRGMENLMMDMVMEDPLAEILFNRVEETAVRRAEIFAEAGTDILYLGDDVGMQSSVMMSDELYTTWIKPRLKRVIAAAKRINPDIVICYHSCGYVEPFIHHFIEAGVEVLNPIQPESMDFERIHSLFGGAISFHGTIGTQTTMPFGTADEITQLVHKNLRIAGEKGGLLVGPTHVLEPDVPWENVLAYVKVCKEFC
jgi:Uroporphyrinogen-III decarboxylase